LTNNFSSSPQPKLTKEQGENQNLEQQY